MHRMSRASIRRQLGRHSIRLRPGRHRRTVHAPGVHTRHGGRLWWPRRHGRRRRHHHRCRAVPCIVRVRLQDELRRTIRPGCLWLRRRWRSTQIHRLRIRSGVVWPTCMWVTLIRVWEAHVSRYHHIGHDPRCMGAGGRLRTTMDSCQPHSEASPERVTFVVRLSTQMPDVAELPRINALAW